MDLRSKLPACRERIAVTMEYLWIAIVILNGNSVYNANALRDYHLLFWCVVATAGLLAVNILLRQARPTKAAIILAAVLAVHGLVYIFVRHEQMTVKRFAYLFVLGLPLLVMTFSAMHRQGEHCQRENAPPKNTAFVQLHHRPPLLLLCEENIQCAVLRLDHRIAMLLEADGGLAEARYLHLQPL